MTTTANLIEWYHKATPAHKRDGKRWYAEAHGFSRRLSLSVNRPLPVVVGVLAALSPRCAWGDNALAAVSILRTGKLPKGCPVLSVNVTKANRIVQGEKPLEVLRGEKVRAFYSNILNPGNSRLVTIDIHAARAAYNLTKIDKKTESYVFRPKGNRELQEAYTKVAQKFNLRPHKLQAIIWLAVRDSLRKPEDPQLHLFNINPEGLC